MKPKLICASSIHLVLLIVLVLVLINEGSRCQVPIGARPLGMGESFVAVADDANAISWNPAGLVQLRQQAINGMYTDLYGIGLVHSYLSYILPLTDQHVIGIDWYSLGYEDEEETYALEHEGGKINIEAIFRAVQINIEGQVETEIVNIEIDNKDAWALWFINSCKHFDFSILDISSPDLPINISNMKSSIIGMQLGNLAGGLAKHSWGLSPSGIILPKSTTLAINRENLLRRVNNLDIDNQEVIFAALALEYTTLTLGKFSSPLLHLIDVLNKATEKLIAEIEELNTEVGIETNDLNEIMQNFTENNNVKFENIFDDIFACLLYTSPSPRD